MKGMRMMNRPSSGLTSSNAATDPVEDGVSILQGLRLDDSFARRAASRYFAIQQSVGSWERLVHRATAQDGPSS